MKSNMGLSATLALVCCVMWAPGCGDSGGGTQPSDMSNATTPGTGPTTGTGGGTTTGATSNGMTGSTNHAPELARIGTKRARVGQELSFVVEATDEDGDMLVFSVFGELPEGAKFDKTRRQFTWTANPNQVGQLVILTFAVTDGDLEDRETVQMTVVSERDNSAPELTPPGDQLVRVGETLELRLEATDPDGDTLSFGIDGPAPQGGVLDPETGVFRWTPTASDQGISLRVLFVVTDSNGARDDALVRLVVSELELGLDMLEAQQVRLGEQLSVTLPISNPEGLEIVCATVGALPAGAEFDATRCEFRWTPLDASLVGQSVEVGFQVSAEDNGEPVVLVTTLTIAVLAGEAQDLCDQDRFEPNDFLEDATVIQGTLVEERALTICSDDWDVFRLDLVAGQQVNITVRFSHAEGDIDLDLFQGAAEQPLLTSWSVTDDESIVLGEVPATGDYYVEIYSATGATSSYTLEIEIADMATCADDAFEPNDSADMASMLPGDYLGTHMICSGNSDFFSVLLLPEELFRATIVFDFDYDLDLSVESPSGRRWVSAGVRDFEEVIIPSTDEGGLYLVEVLGFAGDEGSYLLDLAVSEGVACEPDSSEPNNDASTATSLMSPSGEIAQQTACGDQDWYRFVVPAGKLVLAGLTGPNVSSLRLQAWDITGFDLIGTASASGENAQDLEIGPFAEERSVLFAVDSGVGVTYSLEVLALDP